MWVGPHRAQLGRADAVVDFAGLQIQRLKAPVKDELEDLVQLISQRVGRCLKRQGLLEQDTESAWLKLDPTDEADAMPHILSSSVSYRIAVGPQQGRKAFMIRTLRPLDWPNPGLERVAQANGFSLHAGVSCEGHQRDKWERLCRYIARAAVAIPRLSLSSTDKVVYTLKTPYRDGTTQVAFDPVDFIAIMGYSLQIIAGAGWLRRQSEAKVRSASPTRK